MKALGFNFVRLHTHSMPTEFFDVADELGMLCNPEFAISHESPSLKRVRHFPSQVYTIFDRFELDLRRHTQVQDAAFSCPRLKSADMVLI